jgi:uncharacterized phiE125 gp8 family phage protein
MSDGSLTSWNSGPAVWKDIARAPVLSTAAVQPPVTVEEIKAHLHLDTSDEDDTLRQYIDTAASFVERDAEIALLTSTWTLTLDRFPDWTVELRKPPIQSITSIAYLDTAGDSQTLSASLYRLDSSHRPGRVTPAYAQTWPLTYPVTNAVTITFVAGSTDRTLIPHEAKQAIRMMVGHWYRNRETVVSTGAVPQVLTYAYEDCIRRISWSGQL